MNITIKPGVTDKELEASLMFLHQQILEEKKGGSRAAVNACRTAITTLAQVRDKLLPRDAQDNDVVCGRCGLLLEGQGDRLCYAGGSHSERGDLLRDPESLN